MGLPWVSSDDAKGYVLVSYDANGRVSAYGTDVAREGRAYDETRDDPAAVQAGDVRFEVSGDGDEAFVAVAAARRDEYLRSHPAMGACRVLIGCAGDWCGTRVAIDGRSTVEMPDAVTRWLPAVAPIRVNAGEHQISISPTRWDMSFEAETRFSCVAGESLYVVIDLGSREVTVPGGLRRKLLATVTNSREMPEAFRDQGMLIYANGQWLVPAEPAK
jgi:hypothetical protein